MSRESGRFECPIPWCAGEVWEHGGDGSEPGDWLHSSADLDLNASMWAQVWSVGADAPRWGVHAAREGYIEAEDAESLASMLEAAALALRAHGRLLASSG